MSKELYDDWLRVTTRIIQTAAIQSKDNMDNVATLKVQGNQIRAELNMFIDGYSTLTEEAYNHLDKMIQESKAVIESSNIEQKDERLALLESVHIIVTGALQPERASTFNKLVINAPKNVIYDLVRQFKGIYIKGDQPILSQSNEVIARFIVANFEGFENVTVATVTKELSREQDIRKGKLVVKRSDFA